MFTEGYTLNKGYDVNTNDLVDVTDEFKNKNDVWIESKC
ncbi:hypothetical protein QAY67_03385 [Staphylococcus aureus]